MIGYGPMARSACTAILMWSPLFLILGLLCYLTLRILHSNEKESNDQETPLEALERRYARGEITHDEFTEAKKRLAESEPPTS